MSIIIQYHPYSKSIPFDYTTEHGKNLAEIEEAKYLLKEKHTDTDSAFLEKVYVKGGGSNDITINDTDKTFDFVIDEADYTNLILGCEYYEVFAIRYTGETKFRAWVMRVKNNLDQLSTVTIEPNWANS